MVKTREKKEPTLVELGKKKGRIFFLVAEQIIF